MMKSFLMFIISVIVFTGCSAANAVGSSDTVTDQNIFSAEEIPITEAIAETSRSFSEYTPKKPLHHTDEYVNLSDDAVFYDYILKKDIRSDNISEPLKNLAINAALLSNYNNTGMDNTAEFRSAYTYDYDNDGNSEHFILVDMQTEHGLRSILIFIDSENNVTVMDAFTDLKPAEIIDFGDFRQIIIGGNGYCEADNRMVVFGVIDGKPVKLAAAFGYSKTLCFLVTYSHTKIMELMYYDTGAKEYRVIPRMEIDKEAIIAMNPDADTADKLDKAEHVYVIGSYYYIFEYEQLYKSDNYDVFIYENGAFIKPAETVAMSYYDEYSPNVGNFDIRAAIDKMIDAIPQ